ncbi:hypothetical protein ABGB18_20185 [Nonomuraea sp. B12E4]|uniref:alpha/beta fold hydrolase n=1 Tax=Nonomuraea sp. B12E4 TaxID=3153564 RepID=UPI00325E4B36
MTIFLRDTVGLPAWQSWLAGRVSALVPRFRRLAPCQLDSLEALDRLGVRLDTYARITVPTVLLSGDRSPAHLPERLDAIGRVMPDAERVVMPGRDHSADLRHPRQVAQLIEAQARKVRHLPG